MANKRLKIYYPESQIQRGLYTRGGEWMLEDGTEYIGPYHTYITGEVFTLADWNIKLSKKLIPLRPTVEQNDNYRRAIFGKRDLNGKYVIVNSDLDIKRYSAPKHKIVIPTEDDYKSGYYIRYIVGKRNDPHWPLKEVEKKDLEYYESSGIGINKFLYKLIEIKWKLTGPEFDIVKDGRIILPGVVDTNRRTVFSADNDIYGVSNLLRDLREHSIYSNQIVGDNFIKSD